MLIQYIILLSHHCSLLEDWESRGTDREVVAGIRRQPGDNSAPAAVADSFAGDIGISSIHLQVPVGSV